MGRVGRSHQDGGGPLGQSSLLAVVLYDYYLVLSKDAPGKSFDCRDTALRHAVTRCGETQSESRVLYVADSQTGSGRTIALVQLRDGVATVVGN